MRKEIKCKAGRQTFVMILLSIVWQICFCTS